MGIWHLALPEPADSRIISKYYLHKKRLAELISASLFYYSTF
jgi:hypothetical protein